MSERQPFNEQRWIECEELYKSNRLDSSSTETENDSSSDYHILFQDPDPYQKFYFSLDTLNQDQYHFERHIMDNLPHRNPIIDVEITHKDIVLRGIKAENGQVISSTGLTLWRASTLLCNFICKHYKMCVVNKSILELGAGMGLCGIVCYQMGSCKQVLMTDGDTDVLECMRYNVQTNVHSSTHHSTITSSVAESTIDANETTELLPCRQLIWGHEQQTQEIQKCFGTFDVIIGSDIIYHEAIVEPLFKTVQRLLAPSSSDGTHDIENNDSVESILYLQSVFLLAYARRNVRIDFVLDCAIRHGLQYIIPKTDEGVYIFYRKLETLDLPYY